MDKLLRFRIDGRAVPKERPRLSKYGVAFTPAKTVEYENKVAAAWNDHYGMMTLEGQLKVVISVHTDRCAKQDVDNLAKSILDGLQRAGAFANDSQVYILTCSKYPIKDDFVTWVSISKI